MSVTFKDQPKLRKISVLGTLDSPKEVKTLLSACNTHLPCEIHVFDANTLPLEVIETIAASLDSGQRIILHAYRVFLLHYLTRLNFPVIQVFTYANHAPTPQISAIVIGGSAESLTGILYLIERLPLCDVPVFIVQHILEDQHNILDELLRIRTEYTVIMPTNLLQIQPNTIYIAPPGHHMKLANGIVYLTRDHKNQHARPSLDTLFQSVANEYGANAVAVLLCGFGQDGVQGCIDIRNHGGLVLLEDAAECASASVLPLAARTLVAYDHVLNLRGLACFLTSLLAGREIMPNDNVINIFLEAVQIYYGYDFCGHQISTVKRRIKQLINALGHRDFYEFQREVLTNPAIFERFLMELSINVTSFFRHPEQFRFLREEILPYLNSFPLVKIWSAGCSIGKEVYSLACLLDELGMLQKTYLFATDMNKPILKIAETGLFPYACIEESRNNYLKSGGKGSFDNFIDTSNSHFFKIHNWIHKHIFFHHHVLACDGVFNEFQLIICRNVLIYFTPLMQQLVMEQFYRSLHREGFLILGPSESLVNGQGKRLFRWYNQSLRCYKIASPAA